MTLLASMLLAATPSSPSTTAAASAPKSGSSIFSLLPLLVVAGVFLFLRQRRQGARRPAPTQLAVGDRVQSVGGIRGAVVGIEGDEVRVEVAPGVVMTFVDQALRAAPPLPAAADHPLDDVVDEPVVSPDDIEVRHDHEGDDGHGGGGHP